MATPSSVDLDKTMTPEALVALIKSRGRVTGFGKYKGTNTIHVVSYASPDARAVECDFNIGYNQGLHLIKKCEASSALDDLENVVDAFSEDPSGVFHLLFEHSDATFSVAPHHKGVANQTLPNWYEVDLYIEGFRHAYNYTGSRLCIPLQ